MVIQEQEPRPGEVEQEGRGKTIIWMLDDDPSIIKVSEMSAEANSDLSFKGFLDSQDLIDRFERSAEENRLPNIILLDHTLDSADEKRTGVEVLEELKSRYPNEMRDVEVYGHTGNELAKPDFIEAGARDVLIKPSNKLTNFLFGNSDEI